jgi:DNA-binding PadR family transcriptional regulator
MSEARLLWLVFRYPHPTALARTVQDGTIFTGLRSLERRGLIRRHTDHYHLTRRGRDALAMSRAIARLVARTDARKGSSQFQRQLGDCLGG